MPALHTANKVEFSIDLLRDDIRVIESRGSDLKTIRKSFAKLHAILDKMPMSKLDTVAEVRKTRNSRSQASESMKG